MANDSDWVADVRRWVASNAAAERAQAGALEAEGEALGYEAADPTLQTPHWPTTSATVSEFARLR